MQTTIDHTSCDDSTQIDNIQICRDGMVTLYELFDGCPPSHDMRGHQPGDAGIFMRQLTAPVGASTTEEFTHIHSGPYANENEAIAALEAIREANNAYLVS